MVPDASTRQPGVLRARRRCVMGVLHTPTSSLCHGCVAYPPTPFFAQSDDVCTISVVLDGTLCLQWANSQQHVPHYHDAWLVRWHFDMLADAQVWLKNLKKRVAATPSHHVVSCSVRVRMMLPLRARWLPCEPLGAHQSCWMQGPAQASWP